MTLPPLPSRSSERHIFPTLPNALHACIPVLLAILSAVIADVARNVNVVPEIPTPHFGRGGALSFVVALLLGALPPDAHTEIVIIVLLVKVPPQRKLLLACPTRTTLLLMMVGCKWATWGWGRGTIPKARPGSGASMKHSVIDAHCAHPLFILGLDGDP